MLVIVFEFNYFYLDRSNWVPCKKQFNYQKMVSQLISSYCLVLDPNNLVFVSWLQFGLWSNREEATTSTQSNDAMDMNCKYSIMAVHNQFSSPFPSGGFGRSNGQARSKGGGRSVYIVEHSAIYSSRCPCTNRDIFLWAVVAV